MKRGNRRLVLIAHNVRSAHNVGSLLRTADGLGLVSVYLTGYTPYPETIGDERPPHIRRKVSAAISKTALGAEKKLNWRRAKDIHECLEELANDGYRIVALEQTAKADAIEDFKAGGDIALVVGNEVGGLEEDILKTIDTHLLIPMLGTKESFNASIAAAMALYHLRYLDKPTA